MLQPRRSLNFYLALFQSYIIFEKKKRSDKTEETTLKTTISATALFSCTFSVSWCLYSGSDTLSSHSEGHLTRCWTPEKDLEKCFRRNWWKNLHPAAMSLLNGRVSGDRFTHSMDLYLVITCFSLCRWSLRFCCPLDGHRETDFSISNQGIKMQAQRNVFLTWSRSYLKPKFHRNKLTFSITDLLQLGPHIQWLFSVSAEATSLPAAQLPV